MLTINLSSDGENIHFDGTDAELQTLKQFMIGLVGETEYTANVKENTVGPNSHKLAELDVERLKSLFSA